MPEPSNELVTALAAKAGFSEEMARAFLSAKEDLDAGKPAQTVQRDPSNGTVAVRCVKPNGLTGWWVVVQQDASAVWDGQPDKEWPEIYTPSSKEVVVVDQKL